MGCLKLSRMFSSETVTMNALFDSCTANNVLTAHLFSFRLLRTLSIASRTLTVLMKGVTTTNRKEFLPPSRLIPISLCPYEDWQWSAVSTSLSLRWCRRLVLESLACS